MPATVLDVSYGGLQFETRKGPQPKLPSTFAVDVPMFGLSVRAALIWTRSTPPHGTTRHGASLSEIDPDSISAWQQFVDSMA